MGGCAAPLRRLVNGRAVEVEQAVLQRTILGEGEREGPKMDGCSECMERPVGGWMAAMGDQFV